MTPEALTTFWPFAHAVGLSLVGVLALAPLVIRLAQRMDWLAYPRQDRWHGRPTALMGGIAIYVAATLAVSPLLVVSKLWAVWGGATLMFVVGLVDDLARIRPSAKLAAQVVATGLLLYAGYAFAPHWPLWLSLPLTLLWVVGITNALNLLDNMDGLAAGVAGIAALVLSAFSALAGGEAAVGLGGALVGASFGFLAFNFKPARIFMGDCGSLFLGFVVSALALSIQQQVGDVSQLAVAFVSLAVLAVPILDTTLVTFMRKLSGRSVADGGRDHTSHRLVFLGLSEKHAVLALYGLSLFSGALALALLFVDVKLFYALSVFVGAALGVVGVHLARASVYRQEGGGDGAPTVSTHPLRVFHSAFGPRWKAVVGLLVDVLLVGAAYVLAHYLRFESGLTAVQEEQLLKALPLVVAAKVVVFYAMGLYRGIWRHAGTPELVRLVGATALAVGATAVVGISLHGTAAVSVAVLCIDWMTVTLAVGGVRFGFRGLRQYLASHRERGRRALLYGAGDAGVLLLRELRRNPGLGYTPVAFIDDDPLKQGQSVQGLPVAGTGEQIVSVCREHDVDEVLVTTRTLPASRREELDRRCQEAGIPCKVFDVTFEPLHSEPESVSVSEDIEVTIR